MLSFRDKLVTSHLLVVVFVVTGMILGLSRALSSDLEVDLDTQLEQEARGAAPWLSESGARDPENVAARIAAIVHAEVAVTDQDGHVIADTATPHCLGTETEFMEARRGEVGKSARRAPSGDVVHFVAVRGSDGRVLRLGAPLSGIAETVNGMRDRLIVASLFAVVIALLLGMFFARLSVRPLVAMTTAAEKLARGDYDVDAPRTQDEFGTLGLTLMHLARELKARIGDLTTERDRLSAILRGMAEGVLVFDAKGTVILENPSAKRIQKRAVLGQSLDLAMPIAVVREHVRKCMMHEVSQGEVEAHTADGTLVVYVSPLGEGEETQGVVVVMRDVTEVRRLLTMRKDFVANVSHELRTPIAAISGYAETLLATTLDPTTSRQFLEIIFRQSQRMGVLVEQLLSLSQIESRRPEDIETVTVNVGLIASDVVSAMRGRAEDLAARIELQIPAGSLAVADSEGLERVLVNLVDNALKYGKKDGKVRVYAESRDGRLRLSVADEGHGIEASHLPRLFERFYRVDHGRTREKGGAGLGLAIVKHLVEAMGGQIEVTSTLGEGTTFIVSLAEAKASVVVRAAEPV